MPLGYPHGTEKDQMSLKSIAFLTPHLFVPCVMAYEVLDT